MGVRCDSNSSFYFFVFACTWASSSAWAQTATSIALPLSSKQQTALGVQVAPLQAANAGAVLVTASVVAPPGKEVAVSAPYPGQVARWLVGVGDSVKAGAPLAQFTSPMLGDARRQLNEAALDYKNASAAAQRDQAMFDEGIIPAVRLQLSRAKQEAAQAQLHSREAELSAAGVRFDANTSYATGTLKAPIAGVVVDTAGTVGKVVLAEQQKSAVFEGLWSAYQNKRQAAEQLKSAAQRQAVAVDKSLKAYSLGEGTLADVLLIGRMASDNLHAAQRMQLETAELLALIRLDLHEMWDFD